jgi:hypothetical protein
MPEERRPASSQKMNPVLKGCLIAFAILAGLVLLAVGACFGFVVIKTW